MADINGNIVSWKNVWQIISGIHYESPKPIVLQTLRDVRAELLTGILSKPTNKVVAKEIKDKASLLQFSQNVQQFLNINEIQASNLICSYLINDYKGSAASLINCLAIEQKKLKLLSDIVKYYSLERMILIKVVKNILELHKSKQHPYSEEYTIILGEMKLPELRKSYISQLESLVNDMTPIQTAMTEYFCAQNKYLQAERKIRETIEILQVIWLTIEFDGIEANEFLKLLDLFKMHSFGKQQQHLDGSNGFHNEFIARVTYSEVAIYLKCIDFSVKKLNFTPDNIKSIEKQIIGLHNNAEHGPFLLGWMLFQFQNSKEDEDHLSKYRQFGSKAVSLGVFDFLHAMISHDMYRDQSTVARLVRKSVYNCLTQLCDLFDLDGSLAQHAKIFDLLQELLKSPAISKDFCGREDDGVRSLYNTALETFPVNFNSLSMIADAVASSGANHQLYIRKQLENLEVYCEYYKPDSIHVKPSVEVEDEFILLENYAPFKKIDYIIPAGTTVIFVDTHNTVHFRTKLNYFDVLHNEINELLADTLKYTSFDEIEARMQRVTVGLQYLATAVCSVRHPSEISKEMVHPTEMVFDVLMKFKNVQQPPIQLLAKCLDICTALVPLFEVEIFQRIINLNILPLVKHKDLDYKTYCSGTGFESGLVGYYLINFEKKLGKYNFLISYLNFLKTYTVLSLDNTLSIELPGLIFLLREIFPHVHTWRFENEIDRQQIYSSVMQYFLEILQLTVEQVRNNKQIGLLRDTCIYSLLNLDNGMSLLRFIAIGNDHLQIAMQKESNWMTASSSGLTILVQQSMTILMQILRLRHDQLDRSDAQLTPLESIIYTQPKQRDNLRIIPVVTSYMSNIFNRRLPVLSCRLLRRFAIEFQMSLLACLDMEPDQIRLTFLQRLTDDLESDLLKVAVIEFVEACINKQPGLTEAFFKIKTEKRYLEKQMPKTREIGDGILTYMTNYLETISVDSLKIVSILAIKIMSLFHALWKKNMQSLVQDLTKRPTFWPSMFSPLFGPIKPDIQAYSQLFNILGIEVFRCHENMDIDVNLKKSLEKFFTIDVFSKWTDSILGLPKETIEDQVADETPEWLCRLQSFKDFVVIILRRTKLHGIEIPHKSRKYLADKCLAVLSERAEYTDDLRPFIILADFYLMILLSFSTKYTENQKEDKQMLLQIGTLMNQTNISYMDMHTKARESILTIALKSLDLLTTELSENHVVATDFIRSAVEMFCFEIFNAELIVKDSGKQGTDDIAITSAKDNADMPFILSANLLKKISINFEADLFTHWQHELVSNKILNRILSCLNASLQVYTSRKLVIELLDLLIVLAKNPQSSMELLHCDIGDYLWLKLLPPKELLQIFNVVGNGSAAQSANKWQTNDWWAIYARGIELVTTLLQHHQHIFLKEAILFVGVHEEYLMDSILLGKQVMHADAVMLIKTSLLFVCEMIRFEKQWRLEHSHSMFNLMRSVQIMMDHSVSLLYRPKNLKRLIDGLGSNTTNTLPTFYIESESLTNSESLANAMNDLIEFVKICASCLLVFSPKLQCLIVEPEFVPSQWQPLVEIQFGAPKLSMGGMPQLTFGTVLSAASIFTKTLVLQHYQFHEFPLNKLNSDDDTVDAFDSSCASPFDNTRTRQSNVVTPPASTSSSRSPFTKSLSMTSNTSVAIPSNEILSGLDERLCMSALELVMTLLASQSLLALNDINLSNREKQLIKRELSTELSIYHDFVRKRLLIDAKDLMHKKKRGIVQIKNVVKKPEKQSIRSQQRQSQSMRVSTIRKLHLSTQAATPHKRISFDTDQDISPIGSSSSGASTSKKHLLNEQSTPAEQQKHLRPILKPTSSFRKDSMPEHQQQRKEIEEPLMDADEPVFTGLSYVKMVEEDYLHFLSNLFTHVCQNE